MSWMSLMAGNGGGGGGGGASVLVVNVSEESGTLTLDKTFSEIRDAMTTGLAVTKFEMIVGEPGDPDYYKNIVITPVVHLYEEVEGNNPGAYTVTAYDTTFTAQSENDYPSYTP